jgi:hypothetical protein
MHEDGGYPPAEAGLAAAALLGRRGHHAACCPLLPARPMLTGSSLVTLIIWVSDYLPSRMATYSKFPISGGCATT